MLQILFIMCCPNPETQIYFFYCLAKLPDFSLTDADKVCTGSEIQMDSFGHLEQCANACSGISNYFTWGKGDLCNNGWCECACGLSTAPCTTTDNTSKDLYQIADPKCNSNLIFFCFRKLLWKLIIKTAR